MKQSIAIIHYNTPELTEACILSLRKTGCTWPVHVLDNSDARPFRKRLQGVTVHDNTKGQIIDFEKELEKYPDKEPKNAIKSNFGSAKHCMSVQWLWELLPEGFILVESDVLVKKDIRTLWKEQYAAVGEVRRYQPNPNPVKDRYLPYLLYMNVPKLTAAGARFFDPQRCWCLQKGESNPANWYDTGACLLEDVRRIKPALVGLRVHIAEYIDHYKAASWERSDLKEQTAWIMARKRLWEPFAGYKLGEDDAVNAQNAKIYVSAHKDFVQQVFSPVYEVVDYTQPDEWKGVPGAFFSELLYMLRLAQCKRLPEIVGFVQYRKYFDFMDNVPKLEHIIQQHGAIVGKAIELGRPMRDHYASFANAEDLDIATAIIEKRHHDFANTWSKALESHMMHPASLFIMGSKDFRKMVKLIRDVVEQYLKATGGDIDAHIASNMDKYPTHLGMDYQRRVGGQLCERMVSAWIDWQMPDAMEVKMKVTGAKI